MNWNSSSAFLDLIFSQFFFQANTHKGISNSQHSFSEKERWHATTRGGFKPATLVFSCILEHRQWNTVSCRSTFKFCNMTQEQEIPGLDSPARISEAKMSYEPLLIALLVVYVSCLLCVHSGCQSLYFALRPRNQPVLIQSNTVILFAQVSVGPDKNCLKDVMCCMFQQKCSDKNWQSQKTPSHYTFPMLELDKKKTIKRCNMTKKLIQYHCRKMQKDYRNIKWHKIDRNIHAIATKTRTNSRNEM